MFHLSNTFEIRIIWVLKSYNYAAKSNISIPIKVNYYSEIFVWYVFHYIIRLWIIKYHTRQWLGSWRFYAFCSHRSSSTSLQFLVDSRNTFQNLASKYINTCYSSGGLVVRTLDTESVDVSSIATTDINFTLFMFHRLC